MRDILHALCNGAVSIHCCEQIRRLPVVIEFARKLKAQLGVFLLGVLIDFGAAAGEQLDDAVLVTVAELIPVLALFTATQTAHAIAVFGALANAHARVINGKQLNLGHDGIPAFAGANSQHLQRLL